MSIILKFLDKKDLYLSLSDTPEHKDKFGWCSDMKCDGLLFNSLWSIGGADIDILAARDASLKWHRHPAMNCYTNRESKSEISRDMLLGLLLWSIFNRRSDVISDLIRFGEGCEWVMGEGDLSRTYLTASLRSTIYHAAWLLYGQNSLIRFLPKDWAWPLPFSLVTNQPGYKRHLQCLHILALSLMREPHKRDVAVMKHHAEHEPLNALYQAIYNFVSGQSQDSAIALLMNEFYFPDDRLPSNRNYRGDYLYQHDQTSLNWAADYYTVYREHAAIEWLFAAKIIEIGGIWRVKKLFMTG